MKHTEATIKKNVYQAIEGLPEESFEELFQFLDFLKLKYLVKIENADGHR